MAFTSDESLKCVVQKAEKIVKNGSFVKWVFIVMDSYGEHYEWEDSSEKLNHALTPTDTEVSEYIHAHLTGGAHASGGGNYSSVSPTQDAVAVKENITTRSTKVVGRTPNSAVTNQPGSTL